MTSKIIVYPTIMQRLMKMMPQVLMVILLLFVTACKNDDPAESTPTEENGTSIAAEEAGTPTVSRPTSTRPTTLTPTLRATPAPSESDNPQLRPLASAINIRSGPGEGFDRIAVLYEDETAVVIGTNDFSNWYEIETEDGEEGWVGASVVELIGSQAIATPSPTPRPRVTADPDTTRLRITINLAFVRSGPGQNYPVIESLSEGSTVTVLGYVSGGSWFNIRIPDNRRGWIGATVTEPVDGWALSDISVVATIPVPPPTQQANCDPAYPSVCIPSPPPDLDCRDIEYRNFTVLAPDPHLFDGNQNGIGCETITE